MSEVRRDMSVVGESIIAENAGWSFEGDVPVNFDKHISSSVPFYDEGHDLIAKLSDFFISDFSVCYDLGCSTGSLSHILSQRHKSKDIKIIAVDNVLEMLNETRKKCGEIESVQIFQSDIMDLDFELSDFIVAYYTLQFVKPKNRQIVIDRIYKALNWGGAFLLFEKVRACDARFQDITTVLYSDYKLEKGYTPEEIINKTRSLKGVLEPFSTQGNLDLLKRAGFVDIITVMKYINFEGFLAIK
jgi:tRNA (cmo5U34)-methyltransferase